MGPAASSAPFARWPSQERSASYGKIFEGISASTRTSRRRGSPSTRRPREPISGSTSPFPRGRGPRAGPGTAATPSSRHGRTEETERPTSTRSRSSRTVRGAGRNPSSTTTRRAAISGGPKWGGVPAATWRRGPTGGPGQTTSLASGSPPPAAASGFAAAWLDAREGIPRIYGQRLSVNGSRIGGNHAILAVEPVDPVFALDLDADPLGGYWLCYAEGIGVNQRLWIVHLDGNLLADRSPSQVAPSMIGERANPSIGSGPDGRVEVAWLGAGVGGRGQCYHQAFDSFGAPLSAVFALGPADGMETQAVPRLSVAGETSIATWEADRDGNWSVWLQAFTSGAIPKSGVVRIDQDVLGA